MAKDALNETSSKQEERLGLLIWFRISRIFNRSIREANQHLKGWNLSAAQFDVLAQIGSRQGLTQQELADKLFVTKGNIAQLLSKMEEQGWIRREQSSKNKCLFLTESGQLLHDNVVPKQELFQSSQFDGLDEDEKRQLLFLLKKIQKNR